MQQIRQVDYHGRIIEYTIYWKNVKNINLRVKPDGRIIVSANDLVPVEIIDEFVQSKGNFIIEALNQFSKYGEYPYVKKKYEDGEVFWVLGLPLVLVVGRMNVDKVQQDNKYIYLYVKDENDFKRKERVMKSYFKKLQLEILTEICKNIYQKFEEYNIKYPIIKIRKMLSRWGSCRPQQGIITLNSKLIEKKREAIEYVVLHEFAHLIYPNHSKQFYQLIEKLMPDYKKRDAMLSGIQKKSNKT